LFVVIWKFVPKIGLEKEFEKIYGPHGLWTELFAQVNDYLGTSLLKEVDSENVYLAVDQWKSKDAYESFKLRFFEEYHTIDQRCKDITDIEQIIGEFNTKY
jgi:hypothetical protein